MIDVEHLTKRYGPRSAVEDISFRVEQGEVVGFLGPNGAGKSTTLRMLTGFLAPTSGRVRIDGIDMFEDPIAAKARIGYMPEAAPLYLEMRVSEYLSYRAELKGVPSARVASRIEACVAEADVKAVADRIIGQLSKGTRQRVALADALIADPPVLVLDEPTAGLDPNQIRHVRDLIKSYAGRKTILLSTHILPEVEASCSRVVIVHRGRVLREGKPSEIRMQRGVGRAVLVRARASRDELVSAFEGLEVEVTTERDGLVEAHVRGDGEDLAEKVFAKAVSGKLVLSELRPIEGASLEDVFSDLTTEDAPKETP